jgi:hypothetical protein
MEEDNCTILSFTGGEQMMNEINVWFDDDKKIKNIE